MKITERLSKQFGCYNCADRVEIKGRGHCPHASCPYAEAFEGYKDYADFVQENDEATAGVIKALFDAIYRPRGQKS